MQTKQIEGQMSIFDLGTWFGRMCPEPSAPTKEKISAVSSKKQRGSSNQMPIFLDLRNGHTQDVSWETDGVSLGDYMTHSTGVCLKDAKGYVLSLTSGGDQPQEYSLNCGEKPSQEIPSKLSWILEWNADEKYKLSPKACLGILRRAMERGKELPEMLKRALERQSKPKEQAPTA